MCWADDAALGWLFDDVAALRDFVTRVDVITFDSENLPVASVQVLKEHVPVYPNPEVLAVAQDRLSEKTLFRDLGIPVPDFVAVDNRAALDVAIVKVGTPCILKTRRFGYDGKGQFRIKTLTDADAAWAMLGEQAGITGLILEAFVPFQREMSILAVRGCNGQFRSWPLTEIGMLLAFFLSVWLQWPLIPRCRLRLKPMRVYWLSDWTMWACSH